jgi:hypothetical protein
MTNPQSNDFNLNESLYEIESFSLPGVGKVSDLLNIFYNDGGTINYNNLVDALNTAVNRQLENTNGFRTLATVADGTVIYDSGKAEFNTAGFIVGPGKNTWENEQKKSINENHNTRPEILLALLNGMGKSVRTSTSVGKTVRYQAERFGNSTERALGVVRVNIPSNL